MTEGGPNYVQCVVCCGVMKITDAGAIFGKRCLCADCDSPDNRKLALGLLRDDIKQIKGPGAAGSVSIERDGRKRE